MRVHSVFEFACHCYVHSTLKTGGPVVAHEAHLPRSHDMFWNMALPHEEHRTGVVLPNDKDREFARIPASLLRLGLCKGCRIRTPICLAP